MALAPEITLMGFFGMGPVQNLAKSRLFGGPYLHFADVVTISGYLFQSGALLGRAKLGQLNYLAKMFADPRREPDVIKLLQDSAKRRLDDYVDTYGEEPFNLMSFILASEYKKTGIIIPLHGLELTDTNKRQVAKVAKVKMPLKEVESTIKYGMVEGIGFGSLLPDLTETMYRESNDDIDIEAWELWKESGLEIPESPTVVSLEEQDQTVLSMVATYAQAYFPELIEPLKLTEVLSQLDSE